MDRVPVATLVATGVVLSVKLPKVPMPATAAAVPMIPSEPTIFAARLRALALLFTAVLLSASGRQAVPGDRNDLDRPTAGAPPRIRKRTARWKRLRNPSRPG